MKRGNSIIPFQKYSEMKSLYRRNGTPVMGSKEYKDLLLYEIEHCCVIDFGEIENLVKHLWSNDMFRRENANISVQMIDSARVTPDDLLVSLSELTEYVYEIVGSGYRDSELTEFGETWRELNDYLEETGSNPILTIKSNEPKVQDLVKNINVEAMDEDEGEETAQYFESIASNFNAAWKNLCWGIKEDMVKIGVLRFARRQSSDYQISTIKMDVLTKKEILGMTSGEITECVGSGGHDISEQDRMRNTIFNKIVFGSGDKHNRDSARYKNFGHIGLTLPVVHPDKYSSTRNYLMTLLGLKDGKTISELIRYESFIIIPKDKEWYSAFNAEYTQLLNGGSRGYASKIQIPVFMPEEGEGYYEDGEPKTGYARKYLSFDVINYKLFSDGEAKQLYPNLSNRNFWKSVLAITGAYALVYLMAQINVNETIRCGSEFLKSKMMSTSTKNGKIPSSMEEVSEFIETLSNRTKNGGDLLDVVTDVIPVIPIAYRDFNKVEEGGVIRIVQPPINIMYNSILQKDIDIREKTHGRQFVPYEIFYECVRKNIKYKAIIENPELNDTGLNITELIDMQRGAESVIMSELETLNFLGSGVSSTIMNIQSDIQDLLYKHIYSTGDAAAKNKSILDELGGKYGTIRDIALAKRVDFTARSVITPDPKLMLDEIGIPVAILIKWFKEIIMSTVQDAVARNKIKLNLEKSESAKDRIRKLLYKIGSAEEQPTDGGMGKGHTKLEAHRAESQAVEKIVMDKLREICRELAVLGIRYPSLWRYNEMGGLIVPVLDNTIHIHPLICPAYNADFDGDTFSLFLAQLEESIREIKELLLPSSNFMDTGGNALFKPTQDSVLGLYIMTMIESDDTEPNVDPAEMVLNYINNEIEAEKQQYMQSSGKIEVSAHVEGRLREKLQFKAYKSLKIKPVVKYYPCFGEMYSDYLMGNIKTSDKVSVQMPIYTEAEFYKEYKKYMDLANPQKVPTVECNPVIFGAYDVTNPLHIKGSLESMSKITSASGLQPLLISDSDGTEQHIELDNVRYGEHYPIVSTVGMFIFNTVIPQNLGITKRDADNLHSMCQLEVDYGYLKSKGIYGIDNGCIKDILLEIIDTCNKEVARYSHVKVMRMGFNQATLAGMSLSVGDLEPCPERDKIIEEYQRKVDALNETDPEKRHDEMVRLWTECTLKVQKVTINSLPHDNTLYLMSVSGARGNAAQITQILGMRGLLIDPTGKTIATPVKHSFIDGMNAMDSSISSYGAGKGMIDKANKTKDTGAFARTAMFGSSSVRVVCGDCGDKEGTWMYRIPYNYGNLDPKTCIGRLPFDNEYECITPNRTIICNDRLLLDEKGTLRMFENKQIFNLLHWYAYNPHIMRQGELVGAIKLISINEDGFKANIIFIDREFFVRVTDTNTSTCPNIIMSGRKDDVLLTDRQYKLDLGIAVVTNKKDDSVGHGFMLFSDNSNAISTGIYENIRTLNDMLEAPYIMYSEFKQYTDKHGVAYKDAKKSDVIAVIGGKLVGESTDDENYDVVGTYKPGMSGNSAEILLLNQLKTGMTYACDISKGIKVTSNDDNTILYALNVAENSTQYNTFKIIQGDIVFYPHKALVLKTPLSFNPDIVYDGLYYHNNSAGKTTDLSKSDSHYLAQNYKLEFKTKKMMVQLTTVSDERESTSILEMTDIVDKLIGHFTLDEVIDKYSGRTIIDANSPIKKIDGVTNSMLDLIDEQYPEGIFVRSVLTCKAPMGVCAKCYGYNHGFHRYAQVGDLVSASASHSMSEYLSQSTMRTFHTGGAAIGGDVADTFEATAGLLLHGRIDDNYIKALLAEITKVSPLEINCIREKVKALKSFYTYDENRTPIFTGISQEYKRGVPKVHKLEYVKSTPNPKAGEVDMATGKAEPDAFVERMERTGEYSEYGVHGDLVPVTLENYGLAKLGEYRELYNNILDRLVFIFKHSGKTLLSADMEIMATCTVQFLTTVYKGESEHVIMSTVNRRDILKQNTVLSLDSKDAFVVCLGFTNISNIANNSKDDAVLALSYQNVKKVLGDATMNARVVNSINPIVSPLAGTKMETGKNLDPEKYVKIAPTLVDSKKEKNPIDEYIEKTVNTLISQRAAKIRKDNAVRKQSVAVQGLAPVADEQMPKVTPIDLIQPDTVDATQFGAAGVTDDADLTAGMYDEHATSEFVNSYDANLGASMVGAVSFGGSIPDDLDEYTPDDEDDEQETETYADAVQLIERVESISFDDNDDDTDTVDTESVVIGEIDDGFGDDQQTGDEFENPDE